MKKDNEKREWEIWDSKSCPVAWIYVVVSSTHRISTTLVSSNENINISNGKQSCNGNT